MRGRIDFRRGRRRGGGVLALAVLALASCQTSATSRSPDRSVTLSGKPSTEVTSDDATRALSTQEGLPPGFRLVEQPKPGSPSAARADLCGARFKVQARAEANATLADQSGKLFVFERFAAYAPGKAAEFLAELRRAARSCATYRDETAFYQVVPDTFSGLGDENVALHLSFTSERVPVVSERVTVRMGDFVVRVALVAPTRVGVDRQVVRQLLERALSRLSSTAS